MLLSSSLSGKDERKNSKAYENPNTQAEVDQFHLRSPIKSHGGYFYPGCCDKQVAVMS